MPSSQEEVAGSDPGTSPHGWRSSCRSLQRRPAGGEITSSARTISPSPSPDRTVSLTRSSRTSVSTRWSGATRSTRCSGGEKVPASSGRTGRQAAWPTLRWTAGSAASLPSVPAPPMFSGWRGGKRSTTAATSAPASCWPVCLATRVRMATSGTRLNDGQPPKGLHAPPARPGTPDRVKTAAHPRTPDWRGASRSTHTGQCHRHGQNPTGIPT